MECHIALSITGIDGPNIQFTYHASSDDNVSGSVNRCRHLSSVAGPLLVSTHDTSPDKTYVQ